ncbi:MAG: acetolactate synthase small subunit [Zetaproteobacteria bacterium CG12_big_fil_rev_8_21_14_0_65_55_1124]|nr:MAG: acetolactate synthase small subunit [Zetaproteobacteria bacterium CG1_02_55_237]PIS20253.1 MAG: acetolactate synthase small subunit [Zetaproteobacteria bacterium CG08_land_8_20_14_0_20_55_17]PIW43130.1 MAG: acetolactate synthase small subunit [Zetaproteobacteria bacterium CG12_big_fil_rev_8_21_14_0_65_55_1124]PIY52094.1 MAG: acetolactate synthase small subunit [Zetaproteobacteria bacterium CG_4_10_14_0_8_um_filter_55_43]PIZ38106.1 MAG: acetolactate synthase small subunit [Zetaproteobact
MRHTITILVENEFGVLTRVAGLFSARGYNIESLNVAPTLDETVSRMTLVTRGDEKVIEQIKKQLNKLIPVIKVEDISHLVHIEREMLLVKVASNADNRSALVQLAEDTRCKIVDNVEISYLSLETTGSAQELDDFIKALEPYGIIEITRTGSLGMRRGIKGFTIED